MGSIDSFHTYHLLFSFYFLLIIKKQPAKRAGFWFVVQLVHERDTWANTFFFCLQIGEKQLSELRVPERFDSLRTEPNHDDAGKADGDHREQVSIKAELGP